MPCQFHLQYISQIHLSLPITANLFQYYLLLDAAISQLVSCPSYWHSSISEIDVAILDQVIPLLKTLQVLNCTLKIQTKYSDQPISSTQPSIIG